MPRKLWPALVVGFSALCVAGCIGPFADSSPLSGLSSSWPWKSFRKNTRDEVPGIVAPVDRAAELKTLAETAGERSREEQQRISADLTQAIKAEEDPLLRARIIRTLGQYPTELAGVVLRAGLKDSEPDVRIACCKAWSQRRGPEATHLLSEILSSDTNVDVRLAAARALGESKDPAAVATLTMALDDSNPALQYRAVQSLKSITGQDYGNDFDAWRQLAAGGRPVAKPRQRESMAQRLRKYSPF